MKMLFAASARDVASVLCHVLVVGLVAQTRFELNKHLEDGNCCHRELTDDEVSSSATTGLLFDELNLALNKQANTTAHLKNDVFELREEVVDLSRIHRPNASSSTYHGDTTIVSSLREMRDELSAMRRKSRVVDDRVASLETEMYERSGRDRGALEPRANTTWRKLQHDNAGDCDASGVCTARIITRSITLNSSADAQRTIPQRGRRRARRRAQQATACDFGVQSAAVMDACCSTGLASGGGHRRVQVDCPLPKVCPNVGCAEVFDTFYTSCRSELAVTPELDRLASLAASCDDMLTSAHGSSVVHLLNLECTDDSTENCVPPCNVEYHGFILLLNIDGSDSKYSCNLAHGLYSWLGEASQGGFIGSDLRAFLSSILSGSAGTYATQVAADVRRLEIDTDVIMRPGQKVRVVTDIEGSLADWGSGTITVQDQASLELIGVRVTTRITIDHGSASFRGCDLRLQEPLVVPKGANDNKMTTLSFEDTVLNVAPITAGTFAQLTPGIVVGSAVTMDARGLEMGANVYVGVLVATADTGDGPTFVCPSCNVHMDEGHGMYAVFMQDRNQFLPPSDTNVDMRALQNALPATATLEG
ncbi:MAG: hypothetical protein VXX04_01080, partial [Actinomycetota bacterium]|nr:hypothetical protein [Actinomycetota bacterium]